MTEHRPPTATQDRGHPRPVAVERASPDRVNAIVHRVQASVLDPMPDCGCAEAEVE
jgi:hypothetical protein